MALGVLRPASYAAAVVLSGAMPPDMVKRYG